MQTSTRLHRCFAESKLALGVTFALNSPTAAEFLVGAIELDFIIVDLQHAAIGVGDMVHLLRSVQAVDQQVTPLVRLPNHDVYWIQQSLDAGFAGLIVPLVESAGQAKALVQATYFPPAGARSTAGNIRASLYPDYLKNINDHVILLPQIESADGLENVEEILAVDGVTGILMGPADLSLSCGWPFEGVWSHGPFTTAIKRILASCRQHGKEAATLTGGDTIYDARKAGFNMIGIASDVYYARNVMSAEVKAKFDRMRAL